MIIKIEKFQLSFIILFDTKKKFVTFMSYSIRNYDAMTWEIGHLLECIT